jgi:hypothetical protein
MHVRFLLIMSFIFIVANAGSGAIAGEVQDSNNKPFKLAQNDRNTCVRNCGYALQRCGGSNSCLAQHRSCVAGC